jgi:hypothetical protein
VGWGVPAPGRDRGPARRSGTRSLALDLPVAPGDHAGHRWHRPTNRDSAASRHRGADLAIAVTDAVTAAVPDLERAKPGYVARGPVAHADHPASDDTAADHPAGDDAHTAADGHAEWCRDASGSAARLAHGHCPDNHCPDNVGDAHPDADRRGPGVVGDR